MFAHITKKERRELLFSGYVSKIQRLSAIFTDLLIYVEKNMATLALKKSYWNSF